MQVKAISRNVTRNIIVIVVVLNDKFGLQRTLNSIYDQDIRSENCRIVIVDGFSEDGTFELAKSMLRENGKIIRSKPLGIYDAMNIGLMSVFGYSEDDGVIFLNAGDFLYSPKSLAKLSAGLDDNPQVFGLSAFLDTTYSFDVSLPEIDFSGIKSPVLMWIPHQSFCATIGTYRLVGLMNDHFQVAGDVDWFMRAISIIGIPHHIPEIISVQMVGGKSRRYAYLGYQERQEIASKTCKKVDRYPFSLAFKIYFSQKLGIRLPRVLQKKSKGPIDCRNSVEQRYTTLSRAITSQEFPPAN